MRWIYTPRPAAEIETLGQALGLNPVLAELLLAAGITEPGPAAEFMQPALAALRDPFLLRNLEAGATRLGTSAGVAIVLGHGTGNGAY
jgi:single-stranded-DNA-specific exonuclease